MQMRLSPQIDHHRVEDDMRFDEITLDYDVKYEKFWDTDRYNLCKEFMSTYPNLKRAWIRRSASGRVHIKFDLKESISTLELLLIRNVMIDDNKRLKADMWRIYLHGEINVLFDKKYIKGKVKYSSEWMELK